MAEERVWSGLEVFLVLQRLARLTNARRVEDCTYRDGDRISMSALASPYFPSRALAATLVERCRAEGVISTVAGGGWGFKLDANLSAEAGELLEQLDFTMAVISVRLCEEIRRERTQRVAAPAAGFEGRGMKNAVTTMPANENTNSLTLVGSKRLPLREIVRSIRASPTPKNIISLVLGTSL